MGCKRTVTIAKVMVCSRLKVEVVARRGMAVERTKEIRKIGKVEKAKRGGRGVPRS